MKKIIFIILVISVSVSNVLAGTQFTGTWRGVGTVVDQNGLTHPGCQLLLELRQTDTRFSVVISSYDCGELRANFHPFTLEIRGNDLFLGEEKVGSIEDDHIQASNQENQKFKAYYDLKLTNDSNIRFVQNVFDSNPNFFFTITGDLKKRSI